MNYEKPVLIDFALENKAEGFNSCKSGGSATKCCSFGSSIGGSHANNCGNGSNAAMRCQAGAAAGGNCRLGSLA